MPSTKPQFDVKSLRLSQDFESLVGVNQVAMEVAIGKPNRQTFFRVHPEWSGMYPILEHKAEMRSEFYMVVPEAAREVEDEVHPRLLAPLITRDNRLFIWPLSVGTGEPLDSAASSSLAAMQLAKTQWIKLVWKGWFIRDLRCQEFLSLDYLQRSFKCSNHNPLESGCR